MTKYDQYRKHNDVHALGLYHPLCLRGGQLNDRHQGNSSIILQVKYKSESFINSLASAIVDNAISENSRLFQADVICSVPSSNADDAFNGIRLLAMKVSSMHGYVDGTGCLVRTKNKENSHLLGIRSEESHYMTLCVNQSELIQGKHVLLLDDVTTSGRSLVASANMLLKAGAKGVTKLALGETAYYG